MVLDTTDAVAASHPALRTAFAVIAMILAGVLVGWLLARYDERWRRFW